MNALTRPSVLFLSAAVCLSTASLCSTVAFAEASTTARKGEGCAASIGSPASFEGTVRPASALDLNPDPDVVEFSITAAPATVDFGTGNQTQVWAYNGVIPGPTLEGKVGDTLIVHFCNSLPDPTTIHWHGVETPADMDGSHISQLTVPPGGTFRYEFRLLHPGTFWYHPHVQTHRQVEKGLYGALIVRDPETEADLNLPSREHVLILDDVWLDEAGQVREPFTGSREDVANEQLNGREGNTVLLNGASRPTLTLERGVPHRLRIINASSARFLRMSVPEFSFWRIGGDQGLMESPIEILPDVLTQSADTPDSTETPQGAKHLPTKHDTLEVPPTGLFLTPGERGDVVFFPTGDQTLELTWYDTARGIHAVHFNDDGTVTLGHAGLDGNRNPKVYADIELFGDSEVTEYSPPATLVDLQAVDAQGAPELPLVLGHGLPDWNTGEVNFFIQAPGKPFAVLTPEDVHTIDVGGTYIWSVKNLTGGHHNFHTHGWSFQHLETEFVDLDTPSNNYVEPASHLEWKDTFFIPARPGLAMRSHTISRFAVHFSEEGRQGRVYASGKTPTETRSGGWLAHCHLVEHSARGMMTFFQTSDIFVDGFESGDTSSWQ